MADSSTPHAAGGGYLITFREHKGPNGEPGRTIGFRGVQVRPLGYAELAAAKPHEPLTIPLRLERGEVVETDITDIDLTKTWTADATLESPLTSRAVSLVRGGWLPPTLAATDDDATILLDRNLVPLLVGRARFDTRSEGGDFLDLFQDRPVRLNPLLYAMEGNRRQTPTPDEVAAQLEEAVGKLRKAMPKALVVADPGMLRGALGLIENARDMLSRKQRFLRQVSMRIPPSVGHARVPKVWTDILERADGCGLRRDSLVVLAALSAGAVPNGASPARALLKLKPGYTDADAYNALADLRALELLMALFAMFPDQKIHLCTADRPLAQFWTGLRASDFRLQRPGYAFDLAPVEALLPGETLDWWRSAILAAGDRP